MSYRISEERQLAANFLRQLANAIERNDSSVLNAVGPMLSALIYEDRGVLPRATPTPAKPKPPEMPTIFFDEQGARPLGVRRRVEYRDPVNGQRIAWPHSWMQLAKFARLPEVKRAFWSGKTKIYGDALKLFARAGYVEKRNNGWAWARGFTPLQRKEFAARWKPQNTTSHTGQPLSPNRKS